MAGERWLAGMGVLAFGLWWANSASVLAVQFTMTNALIVMASFVIICGHHWVVLRRVDNLEGRTRGGRDRRDTLRGYRLLTFLAAGAVLTASVIGPMRWLDAGMWTPPSRKTATMAFFAMSLVWLLVTGVLSTTSRGVEQERRARG